MAESAPTRPQRFRSPTPRVGYSGGRQVRTPAAKNKFEDLEGYISGIGGSLKGMHELDFEIERAKIGEKVAIGLVTPASNDPFRDNILYKEEYRKVAAEKLGEDAARVLEEALPGMIDNAMSNFIFGEEYSPSETFAVTLDEWDTDYVKE